MEGAQPLARQVRAAVLARIPLGAAEALSPSERRRQVERALASHLESHRLVLPLAQREAIVREVLQETVGLGPLEPLLQDEQVTEIMVNGPGTVLAERAGRISPVEGLAFRDADHLRGVIDRILAPLGRRLDEASPAVDARLEDGSRVHAILPPVAPGGPLLCIRRFPERALSTEDLIRLGTLGEAEVGRLVAAVRERQTVLITGGASTGKTTLLNALARHIPPGERLIVIEDTRELQLSGAHVVRLEARPPNLEGSGEVTLRELVRHALRMRPDRILIGEVRGLEAVDLLQALNTGHRGSLSTVHANSAPDGLSRLALLCLLGGLTLPYGTLRRHINAAVDMVVHLHRTGDGRRVVAEIAETEQLAVRRGGGRPW